MTPPAMAPVEEAFLFEAAEVVADDVAVEVEGVEFESVLFAAEFG